MNCQECGERIPVSWLYYHNPNSDENYHLSCAERLYEEPDRTMQQRINEE
jgi:hypothetical protein